MHFLKSVSILALAAQSLGAVTRYQFFVKSSNKEIDGHGLYHIEEIDPVQYYFISNNNDGNSASLIDYDDASQEFFFQVDSNVKLYVRELGGILQYRPGPALKGTIGDDGTVSFSGSDALRAQKNINDPKNYSQNNYAVLLTPQVKLNLRKGGDILQMSTRTALDASIGNDGVISFDGSDILHGIDDTDVPSAGEG
ncbi:hypothetical protein KGF57_000026 [Candida theae]|uniref:Uncharacterized protein n=1 Tax=Candida theae TaxID=1198502 RepID=A0AAD5G1F0_9ASCO|nr:uncharacterized protein KGF57_000026 [Candida theae]KAI5968911.1 hypothetical protein KGF57_000026 [Candida theae]